jgi:hypothetical protein
LVFEIPRLKRLNYNRIALIIGALLPDIIDKPFLFLGLGSGRFFSHSLIFIACAFLILFVFTRGNKRICYPFLIGMIFHIILDLPFVPLLFPFIFYEYETLEDPLAVFIRRLFTNPLVITTEISGIIILIFIIINNKLFTIKDILNYLKSNSNIMNEI